MSSVLHDSGLSVQERDKVGLPGGAYTAGTLFQNTTYLQRLQKNGISFEVVSSPRLAPMREKDAAELQNARSSA